MEPILLSSMKLWRERSVREGPPGEPQVMDDAGSSPPKSSHNPRKGPTSYDPGGSGGPSQPHHHHHHRYLPLRLQ